LCEQLYFLFRSGDGSALPMSVADVAAQSDGRGNTVDNDGYVGMLPET